MGSVTVHAALAAAAELPELRLDFECPRRAPQPVAVLRADPGGQLDHRPQKRRLRKVEAGRTVGGRDKAVFVHEIKKIFAVIAHKFSMSLKRESPGDEIGLQIMELPVPPVGTGDRIRMRQPDQRSLGNRLKPGHLSPASSNEIQHFLHDSEPSRN